jgi:amicyanin
MKKSWLIVVGVIVLILIAAVVFYFSKDLTSQTETSISSQENLVLITGYKFVEPTINIKVGDTVTWTNKDSVKHTVTSENGEELNSNLFGKEESYSHKFDTPGIYDYYCVPHPSMKGTVVVTP